MGTRTVRLAGHSGCRLEIEQKGNQYVVTKTAKDRAYNARLEAQVEKQRAFAHDTFRTPAVLNAVYTDDGLYAFSMEYVNGFTLAEHLRTARVTEIPRIAERFLRLLPLKDEPDAEAAAVFAAKLEGLRTKIKPRAGSVVTSAIERLEKQDWSVVTKSCCHGDLTLENVIYKEGALYLIDFLDSFYDSWMQDIGKLLFDLECGWSYRDTTIDANLRTRISIFKEVLLEGIRERDLGRERISGLYHLALLHALRVLPYTHDADTRAYLVNGIRKLQSAIDSL